MTGSRTIPGDDLPWGGASRAKSALIPHLVVIWSLDEPERIGEAIAIADARVIGRGPARDGDPAPRGQLVRQRPARSVPMHPLESNRLSRVQLRVEPRGANRVEVQNLGQTALLVDGQPSEGGIVAAGSTLAIKNTIAFLVVERPAVFDELRADGASGRFEFGLADKHGIVGESRTAWKLRDDLAFAATAPGHVLVRGASGVGKELAACALHAMSSRAAQSMVTRNAATFPEGLVDAELFGNVKGYPNPGMSERVGLIGEADGTTLFLDEIGELPPHLQAHLLRVLDQGGEYQRLGDPTARRADLRLVAATNRAIDKLKHDFAARLTHQLEIPGLDERREDIPLLVRHLLREAFAAKAELATRFADNNGNPRIDPMLIDGLVRHRYTHHLRELSRILWIALSTSRESFIALTPAVSEALDLQSTMPLRAPDAPAPADLDKDVIEAAIAAANGSISQAARALGLKNRFALYRQMKALGISPQRDETDEA